jgi:hypothetical protein
MLAGGKVLMLHLFIPHITLRMFHAKITTHNLVLCATHEVQVLSFVKNCEHEHFSVYTCVHETHPRGATQNFQEFEDTVQIIRTTNLRH